MLIEPNDAAYATFRDLLSTHRAVKVMIAATRLGIFETVGDGAASVAAATDATGWPSDAAERFIACLCELGLLGRDDDQVWLSPFSRRFLWRASPDYQGAALEFEHEVLGPSWRALEDAIQTGSRAYSTGDKSPAEYEAALRQFLAAMDDAARLRAAELWDRLPPRTDAGVILDAGAGSGAYLAEFLERHSGWRGVFCDLQDVIDLARRDPRLEALGDRLAYVPCNLLESDLVLPEEMPGPVDLLLLSNVVHVQGKTETAELIRRAVGALGGQGTVIVHDFHGDQNWQGSLYDLEMLINTYNGRSHSTADVAGMLEDCGYAHSISFALPSHSGVVAAAADAERLPAADPLQELQRAALRLGFSAAVPTPPETVPVHEWVREKCRFGCSEYNTCIAHRQDDIGPDRMRLILAEYGSALTVAGAPPLREFRQRLLDLEKTAFLANHHKALVFAAGPCCVCPDCTPDECRHPDQARPSLEACGVDVYELAELAGLPLKVLKSRDEPVGYIGLLLIE